MGSWSSGRGANSPLSTPRRTSIEFDHHHVPVAGLGLLDDGQAGAGALVFLDIDGDAVGLLERPEQLRIRMVAPDQRVQRSRTHRGRSHGRSDHGEDRDDPVQASACGRASDCGQHLLSPVVPQHPMCRSIPGFPPIGNIASWGSRKIAGGRGRNVILGHMLWWASNRVPVPGRSCRSCVFVGLALKDWVSDAKTMAEQLGTLYLHPKLQVACCSCQPSGPFPSISASLSPFGCRPSRIASTMSGARQVSGRSRQT